MTVRLDGSGNAGDEAAGDVYVNINGMFGSQYGDTIAGNANGNWIIACGGNDSVSGGIGNDTLYGSDGNDDLNGGSDNDVLYGGNGQDVLTGGAGADIFVFDAATIATNVDRIVDFNAAQDRISARSQPVCRAWLLGVPGRRPDGDPYRPAGYLQQRHRRSCV